MRLADLQQAQELRKLVEVAEIVEKNGGKALVVPTDVLQSDQLDRLVERALGELFDVASVLAYQPLPRGDRVAVLGTSAALEILAADAVESSRLTVSYGHPSLAQSASADVAILFKDLGDGVRISIRTRDDGVDATRLAGAFDYLVTSKPDRVLWERTLRFDPKKEQFPSDDEANRLLTRTYRPPYILPDVL